MAEVTMNPVPRACSGAGGMSTARGESARFRASSNNSSAPARPLPADQLSAGIPVN